MLRAQIYRKLDGCWICRLYEPGGYTWSGQVAAADYGVSEEEFIERCKGQFGEFKIMQ